MATDFLRLQRANGGLLLVRHIGGDNYFIEEGFFAFYFSFTEMYGWSVWHVRPYQEGCVVHYHPVLQIPASCSVKEVITKLVRQFYPIRGRVH